MDLQLAGDVAAMCYDRVGREEETIGNLTIGHALDDTDDDLLFATTQLVLILILFVFFVLLLVKERFQFVPDGL